MTASMVLDEQKFRALVAGEIVEDRAYLGKGVTMVMRIILSDIGFDVMRKAIDDAEARGFAVTP